ncbi:MAG: hypothetical protein K2O61_08435, partial [Bacteroidaceae bacterium]|nr:hypothetical protein [Bacteroidaceae bacterium]
PTPTDRCRGLRFRGCGSTPFHPKPHNKKAIKKRHKVKKLCAFILNQHEFNKLCIQSLACPKLFLS